MDPGPTPRRLNRWQGLAVLNWMLGAVLLATYFGASANQERERVAGLEFFEAHRSATKGVPDQSLWSRGRVEEYAAHVDQAAIAPEAVLSIPSVGVEVPVYPGTRDSQLAIGAGRIEGTPDFASGGNVGIAAHRDGFFRGLKDIDVGAEIVVETLAGSDKYEVVETLIVDPQAVHVLDPTPEPALTLVTCYPFYFVGHAPQRFIVRARRVEL